MWNQDLYIKTIDFAARAHGEQEYPGRGYSYIVHPVVVAMEAMKGHEEEPCGNPDLLMQCALLHDVLEDTSVTEEELASVFGETVAQGVMALTKNKEIEKENSMKDSLERILLQPNEIAMVKLADRITNLYSVHPFWKDDKKKEYLREAQLISEMLSGKHAYLEKRLAETMATYQKKILNTDLSDRHVSY